LPLQQSHDLKKAAWKLSESLARFSRRLRSPTPLAPSDAPAHPSALKMLQLFDVRCCRRSCCCCLAMDSPSAVGPFVAALGEIGSNSTAKWKIYSYELFPNFNFRFPKHTSFSYILHYIYYLFI